jgi:hypothetical protein
MRWILSKWGWVGNKGMGFIGIRIDSFSTKPLHPLASGRYDFMTRATGTNISWLRCVLMCCRRSCGAGVCHLSNDEHSNDTNLTGTGECGYLCKLRWLRFCVHFLWMRLLFGSWIPFTRGLFYLIYPLFWLTRPVSDLRRGNKQTYSSYEYHVRLRKRVHRWTHVYGNSIHHLSFLYYTKIITLLCADVCSGEFSTAEICWLASNSAAKQRSLSEVEPIIAEFPICHWVLLRKTLDGYNYHSRTLEIY